MDLVVLQYLYGGFYAWPIIIPIYFTSIINFNYSIPFSSFHNTTKWKELFSLKGTTFVYVLSSNWW
jgi:hypothetical protein